MTKKVIKICNRTKKEIREAYFNSKLAKLLNEIQSEGKLKEKDFKALEEYLSELRKEDTKYAKALTSKFKNRSGAKTSDIDPPKVDELYSELQGKDKDKFVKWQEDCNEAVKKIKIKRHSIRMDVINKLTVNKDQWIDIALEISALTEWLNQDLVYKEQLYRKRLTDIIDGCRCSRAEAEERAKLTAEYREYKIARYFREDTNEFILLCKKKGGLIE